MSSRLNIVMHSSIINIEAIGANIIQRNNNNTITLSITYRQLVAKCNVVNWNGNREPDTTRIHAIKNYIKQNNYVDGVIYFQLSNDKKKLECYDGMHRFTAIRELYSETKNEGYHMLIINVLPYNDDVFVKRKIIDLNQGRPIELYNDEFNANTIIMQLCNSSYRELLQRKPRFKKMYMSSIEPKIPNTTKDKFYVFLKEIIIQFNLHNKTHLELIDIVLKLNAHIKQHEYSNISLQFSDGIINKIKKNDCYLFIFNDNKNKWVEIINNNMQLLR